MLINDLRDKVGGLKSVRLLYETFWKSKIAIVELSDRLTSNSSLSKKKLAVDMGDEIKYQNTFLGGMTTDFENSSNFLKNSLDRVKKISLSGHNRYILYLILFAFFVFFMIYIIIRFR